MEKRRFTYGDQFSPEKMDLKDLLLIAQNNLPNRSELQKAIAIKYFEASGSQSYKMAMNTVLTLNAYQLIQLADKGGTYNLTDFASFLVTKTEAEIRPEFVKHILLNLEGIILLKLIEDMKGRGEEPSLESLAYELNEMGFMLAPNSTYISTMKAWLSTCGVFKNTRGYDIDWLAVKKIIGLEKDSIDELFQLTLEQRYYLLGLINLDGKEFLWSNKVADYVRSIFRIRLTTKTLVKSILEPLEEKGLIETSKTTEGRGAKPHLVKLSDLSIKNIYGPILNNISEQTGFKLAILNKSFEEVVKDLSSNNTHIKGIALELLSVWLVRLLGLHFTGWRVKSRETAGAEVDVLAANDKIIYNRWQIQCKNTTSTIGVDVIAKEVGLTILTESDIIMIVTTNKFSPEAIGYALKVMTTSRYYVILLDSEDLEKIVKDRTQIVEILNQKAEKIFLIKEVVKKGNNVN